jgi:hypothetical protein
VSQPELQHSHCCAITPPGWWLDTRGPAANA